jgi:predicted GNAT family acetyltransferase
VARVDDRDLLLAWHEAFSREVGEFASGLADAVDDRICYGGLMLWEVDDRPVALAGRSRRVAGMVRVAPVYTPTGLRRRGYAAAVTAAVSHAARDRGANEIVLFTDLANPTSNALYQRLGYRPVGDSVVLSFDA